MNYPQLVNIIDQNIRQNGREEITGNIMNGVLKLIIQYFNQYNKGFNGVLKPNSTTQDNTLGFWLATEGTYPNFNLVVPYNNLAVVYFENGQYKSDLIDLVDEQAIEDYINQRLVEANLGFGGEITSLNQNPTTEGMYIPTIEGVYPNFGGLTYDEGDGFVVFLYKDSLFSKINVPLDITIQNEVISESLNAVTSNAVEKYAIKKINNILELKDTQGEYEGQIIELLGYYENGDKPSLKYKWTTTQITDDGGSVINSGSGSWLAVFNDFLYIEDFGVSESLPDNSLQLENAIKLNKILYTLDNKNYKFENNVNVYNNIHIEINNTTKFISVSKNDVGVYPIKLLNINNVDKVYIKGNFDGGFYKNGSQINYPISTSDLTKTSSLINIVNCKEVYLEINIENTCSNYNSTSNIDTIMNYGHLYVRDCVNVICVNSSLTTSRVEGFVFLGNKNVVIKDFKSFDNRSTWTPLHCFLNEYVYINGFEIIQHASAGGSTLNLYNVKTIVENGYLENGAGIDFSWESTSVDSTTYVPYIKEVHISNVNTLDTSRLFYGIQHSGEVTKNNITILNCEHNIVNKTFSDTTPKGAVRIDNAVDVIINNFRVNSPIFNYSTIQSVGNLSNIIIENCKSKSDNFIRFTQNSGYKYNNITVKNNTHKGISLDGRTPTTTSSEGTFVFVLGTSDINRIYINNNIIEAEGRAFNISGESTLKANDITISDNIIKGYSDVAFSLVNLKNLTFINNSSESNRVFSQINNGSENLIIENNLDKSSNKTLSMFTTISGNYLYYRFVNNKSQASNINTYGIINNVSGLIISTKDVYNNTPEVGASKNPVTSSIQGTTANRPTNIKIGHNYFDTTLNKPIWWNGSSWVDLSGTSV